MKQKEVKPIQKPAPVTQKSESKKQVQFGSPEAASSKADQEESPELIPIAPSKIIQEQ